MNSYNSLISAVQPIIHARESEMLGAAPGLTSGMMTLAEAAKVVPHQGRKRVNTSTLWRWCRKGVRGIYLKYARVGRTIMITESDLRTFFTALVEVDRIIQPTNTNIRHHRPRHINTAARQKSIDDAKEILVRAGIIPAASREAKAEDGLSSATYCR